MFSFSVLPSDCIRVLFSKLSPSDVLSLQQVEKAVSRAASENYWKSAIPNPILKISCSWDDCKTYFDVYKKALRLSVQACEAKNALLCKTQQTPFVEHCRMLHVRYVSASNAYSNAYVSASNTADAFSCAREVDEQKLMAMLDAKANIYAVLDGCCRDLPMRLDHLQRMSIRELKSPTNPWVYRMNEEIAGLLLRHNCGIILESKESLEDVASRLRDFSMVLIEPMGFSLNYYRFEDPTIFQKYASTLNVEQAKTLFGGEGSRLFLVKDNELTTFSMTNESTLSIRCGDDKCSSILFDCEPRQHGSRLIVTTAQYKRMQNIYQGK